MDAEPLGRVTQFLHLLRGALPSSGFRATACPLASRVHNSDANEAGRPTLSIGVQSLAHKAKETFVQSKAVCGRNESHRDVEFQHRQSGLLPFWRSPTLRRDVVLGIRHAREDLHVVFRSSVLIGSARSNHANGQLRRCVLNRPTDFFDSRGISLRKLAGVRVFPTTQVRTKKRIETVEAVENRLPAIGARAAIKKTVPICPAANPSARRRGVGADVRDNAKALVRV